jgi:hypothetical protein
VASSCETSIWTSATASFTVADSFVERPSLRRFSLAGTKKNGRSGLQSLATELPSKKRGMERAAAKSSRNVTNGRLDERLRAARKLSGTPSGASNVARTEPPDDRRSASSRTPDAVQPVAGTRLTMRVGTSAT